LLKAGFQDEGETGDPLTSAPAAPHAYMPTLGRVRPAILVGAERYGQAGQFPDLIITEQRGGEHPDSLRIHQQGPAPSGLRDRNQHKALGDPLGAPADATAPPDGHHP